MAFTKITAAGIGSTETVTLDGLTVINDGSFGGNVSVAGTLTYEDVTNIDSVGLITARAGVVVGSGITLSKDGDIFATGITTVSGNVKVGTGITLSPDGDGFFTGVVTATTFKGDGSQLSNVTSTTINNNADNRLITGSGTANTLEGEATLTYDGTSIFELQPSSATPARFIGDANRTGQGQHLAQFEGNWNGTLVGRMVVVTGEDTSNKDDGHLDFFTTSSGGSNERRLRIDSNGRLLLGTTTEGFSGAQTLTIAESGHSGITIRSGDAYDGQVCFSDATSGDGEYAGQIVYDHTDNFMMFRTNGGNERFRITSDGHVLPGANDTYDLGSSSLRWRDIYTGDLNLSNEGKTNDVDGTWGNYTIQEGENDLFLINNRSGKKYKFNLTEVS